MCWVPNLSVTRHVSVLQIRNLYELLLGQHRTNAGISLCLGIERRDEKEWSAVFGYNLRPQIWKKMPMRLAKRLSAGLQAKESHPQVKLRFDNE